ncbi:hypothetical protein LI177_02750 [bacterium 210820-DFI.6.37]|nr:hypothetical protein [bacterium 210820-DFI.6.37]
MSQLEQLKTLLDLCVNINGEKEKRYGDGPSVFFYLYPHVATATFDVFLCGWSARSNPDIVWEYHYNKKIPGEYEEILAGLRELYAKKVPASSNSDTAHEIEQPDCNIESWKTQCGKMF